MSEGEALLRGVLLRPDDDTARLVYADWLQENGDESRAEYIRVECEIAALCQLHREGRETPTDTARQRTLFDRENELGTTVYPQHIHPVFNWLTSAGIDYGRCVFNRGGFLAEVSCPLAAFMEHAKALFSAHPIERVTLTDREPTTGVFHRIEEPNWHLQGKRYWLWDMLRDGWVARHGLPWEIVRHLPRGVGAIGSYQYLSQEDAFAASSQACVAYGRSLAGLPAALPGVPFVRTM